MVFMYVLDVRPLHTVHALSSVVVLGVLINLEESIFSMCLPGQRYYMSFQ